MTDKQNQIIEALPLADVCPQEVSLRTEIPWKEARRELEALAAQGKVRKFVRNNMVSYSRLNPRVRLKDQIDTHVRTPEHNHEGGDTSLPNHPAGSHRAPNSHSLRQRP